MLSEQPRFERISWWAPYVWRNPKAGEAVVKGILSVPEPQTNPQKTLASSFFGMDGIRPFSGNAKPPRIQPTIAY